MFYEMLKKKKKARKLKDVEVEEISIVDRAANQKEFAIIKKQSAELEELLAGFVDDEIKDLTKDEEQAREAVKSALKELKQYVSDMPDTVAKAIKTLAAFAAGAVAGEGYGYGYPAKDEQKDADDEGKDHKVKKSFGGIPGTLDALVHGIVGAARPDIVARWQVKRVQKAIDDGDIVLEEVIDETEGEPHSHGVSKSLKGQGDDDPKEKDDDLWPSL